MKKNIILLLVDQQQKACITDNPTCITPNLDKLMGESIRFNKTHTVNAICSPSRASLITGMLPHNHGIIDCTHTVPEYRSKYDQSLDNIYKIIKEQGYNTAYYGKWHIERSFDLNKFGIDDFMTERDLPKTEVTPTDKVIIKSEGYMDKTIAGVFKEDSTATEEYFIYNKAIEFIENHKDSGKPFFTTLSTYAPHDPYAVPQEIYDLYNIDDIKLPESFEDNLENRPNVYKRIRSVYKDMTEEEYKKTIACYYGYTTLVDMQLGRLVEYLKANNLYDDTMIVFTTDHGDMLGAHGMFCKGITSFEEVYHIPFTIKPPSGIQGNIDCNTHTTTIDMSPTILELMGMPALKGNIDGTSMVPYINGADGSDKISFAEFQGQRYAYTQRIVWKDNYKYVFNGFDYDEFYDLSLDPNELVNQVDNPKYKDIVIDLARAMWNVIKKSGDDCLLNAEYVMLRFAPMGPEKIEAVGEFNTYNKAF